MTTEEKLNWILQQDVDPCRSQIRDYCTHLDDPNELLSWDEPPFYPNKHQTIYYDELAQTIKVNLSDSYNSNMPWYKKEYFGIEIYKELIDSIYEDIQNGYWGFVYNW